MKKPADLSKSVEAALAEAQRVVKDTQTRALQLFHERQVIDRDALWMWLSGSSDTCWRVTDIVERKDSFIVTIALPGVDRQLLELTRQPRELTIRSDAAAAAHVLDVENRIRLPVDLRSDRVTAHLIEGSLVITAPKK
jgi:HSP20 family molecular chaperone IbpA